MPITLVTGLPGHGKTLYTLARFKGEAEKDGRPVFHNNIPGLKIPGWQSWDADKWQDLPPNSIMVVDECQFVYPVRGRGTPPDHIEKLATHRHLGIDFVLITQNPMLMDSFVRRLVDRHFHVVRKFGTTFATIHEFANGCRDNVSTNRKDSIRHEWKYPKDVFEWYTSAQVHTVKRRIPARVYILGLVPFVFAGLAWLAYSRLNPDAQAARIPGNAQATQEEGAPPASATPPAKAATPADYFASFTPRIPGLPHTAPRYDEITKAVSAPRPVACIASASKCICYTQQTTRMDIPDEMCRDLVKGGYFADWVPDPGQGTPRNDSAPSSQGTERLIL